MNSSLSCASRMLPPGPTTTYPPFPAPSVFRSPPPVSLTVPDLTPPAARVVRWVVEGAVTCDGFAAISVAGTIACPGAVSVVVQYRLEGATDCTMAGEFPAISPFQQVIAP